MRSEISALQTRRKVDGPACRFTAGELSHKAIQTILSCRLPNRRLLAKTNSVRAGVQSRSARRSWMMRDASDMPSEDPGRAVRQSFAFVSSGLSVRMRALRILPTV